MRDEEIAFRLLEIIAKVEGKGRLPIPNRWGLPLSVHRSQVSREWLLNTYGECLDAVRGLRKPPSGGPPT